MGALLQNGFHATLRPLRAVALEQDQDADRYVAGGAVVEVITPGQTRLDASLGKTARMQMTQDDPTLIRAVAQRRGTADQQRLADMPQPLETGRLDQAQDVIEFNSLARLLTEAAHLQPHLAVEQPVARQARRQAEQ